MLTKKVINSFITSLIVISIVGGTIANAVEWKQPSNDSHFKYEKLDSDDYFGSINVSYAKEYLNNSITDHKNSWYWRFGYDLQQHHGSALFKVLGGNNKSVYGMCVADQHSDPTGEALTSVYKVDVSGLAKTRILNSDGSKGNSVFFNASDNFVKEENTVWNGALQDSDLAKYSDKEIFLKIVNMIYNGDWTYYELADISYKDSNGSVVNRTQTPKDLPSNGGNGIKLDMSKGHEKGRDLNIRKDAFERSGEVRDFNIEKYLLKGTTKVDDKSYSTKADGESVSGLFNAAHALASYAMTGEKFTVFGTIYYSFNQYDEEYTHQVDGRYYSNYAAGSYGTWKVDSDLDQTNPVTNEKESYSSNAQWRRMQLVQYFNMIAAQKEFSSDDIYIYVPQEPVGGNIDPEQWVLFGSKTKDFIREKRYALLSISKVDASGNPMTGAQFGIYSDSSCNNLLGLLSDDDNNGVYSNFQDKTNNDQNALTLNNKTNDNENYSNTFYVKELKAPSIDSLNGYNYKLKENIIDSNVYRVDFSYKESTHKATYEIYCGTKLITEATVSFDAEISDKESNIQSALDKIVISNNEGKKFIDGASLSISKKSTNGFNTKDTLFTLYEDNGSFGNYDASEDILLAFYRFTDKNGWGWYTASKDGLYLGKTYPLGINRHYGIKETSSINNNLYKDFEEIYYDWENTGKDWIKSGANSWYKNFDTTNSKVGQKYSFEANNDLIYGSLDITKIVDDGLMDNKVFDVYFRGKKQVEDNTKIHIATIKIDEEGKGGLEKLPFGYYEIKESEESLNKYRLSWEEGTIVTSDNTAIVKIDNKNSDLSLKAFNYVDTSFKVTKVDSWSYSASVNYNQKVPGVEFTLYKDLNNNQILDEEEINEENSISKLDDDLDGVVDFDNLGLGTYFLKETKTVDGFYLSDEIKTITISNSIDEYEEVFEDNPVTSLLKIYKIDEDNNKWYLSGAYFELYEDVNGNGKYDSNVDAKAKSFVNGELKDVYIIERLGKDMKPYYVSTILDNGTYEDTNLHFGKYLLIEKVAPENHELNDINVYPFEIEAKDTTVPEFKSKDTKIKIKNKQKFETTIDTKKENRKKHIEYSNKTTVIDYVAYKNLKVGEKYTVKGSLMAKIIDSEGNIKVVDTNITKEVSFVCEDNKDGIDAEDGSRRVSGVIEIPFECDITLWEEYDSVVAFETMYHNTNKGDMLIGRHDDIESDSQTLDVPHIGTMATTENGEKEYVYGSDVTIIDKVSYENLIPGEEYELKGRLVSQNGISEVTSVSKKFKPEKADGVVEVTFDLPVELQIKDTLVVFEDLYFDDIKIATHSDINSIDQSIEVKIFGQVNVYKVDELGNFITGAEFTVYKDINENGLYEEEIDEFFGILSDEEVEGNYNLKNIPEGKYLLIETEAPLGFIRDKNTYVFEISFKDNLNVTVGNILNGTELQFVNVKPRIPATGETIAVYTYLGAVIGIMGFVVLVAQGKNKKHE